LNLRDEDARPLVVSLNCHVAASQDFDEVLKHCNGPLKHCGGTLKKCGNELKAA